MPTPFGPDHHIRIGSQSDAIRIPFDIRNDFHIVKIRKDKTLCVRRHLESETAPEIHQSLLRMAVDLGVTLLLAKPETGAHHLECRPGLAELLADRQPFDLCEIGEE